MDRCGLGSGVWMGPCRKPVLRGRGQSPHCTQAPGCWGHILRLAPRRRANSLVCREELCLRGRGNSCRGLSRPRLDTGTAGVGRTSP